MAITLAEDQLARKIFAAVQQPENGEPPTPRSIAMELAGVECSEQEAISKVWQLLSTGQLVRDPGTFRLSLAEKTRALAAFDGNGSHLG
ncbi:MAG: hypothetical protein ACYDCQ_19020 [Dehalococcoidia bacterium]